MPKKQAGYRFLSCNSDTITLKKSNKNNNLEYKQKQNKKFPYIIVLGTNREHNKKGNKNNDLIIQGRARAIGGTSVSVYT